MPSVSQDTETPQLTFSFEPKLADRFPTLRGYVAHLTPLQIKPAKCIAADMDLAPSTLSRKLNPTDGDTQRLNLDDLEKWIASTGAAERVIEYLAAKYMDSPEARRERVLAKAEQAATELVHVIASLKKEVKA